MYVPLLTPVQKLINVRTFTKGTYINVRTPVQKLINVRTFTKGSKVSAFKSSKSSLNTKNLLHTTAVTKFCLHLCNKMNTRPKAEIDSTEDSRLIVRNIVRFEIDGI